MYFSLTSARLLLDFVVQVLQPVNLFSLLKFHSRFERLMLEEMLYI